MAKIKVPKPSVSVLDPSFRYTPSGKTDISKTFKRVRERMKEENAAEARIKVVPISRKKVTG